MGPGVARVNRQGLVEARQSRVVAAKRRERKTAIAVGGNRAPINPQGLFDQAHGVSRMTLLQPEDSKHMQRIEILWLRSQRLAIEPLGIAGAALLVQLNRLTERV